MKQSTVNCSLRWSKASRRALTLILVLTLLFMAIPSPEVATAAQPFADSNFQKLWNRTDRQVAAGSISRSLLWGLEPYSTGIMENYVDAPNGRRLVQYFDKSRMEITNPAGDQNSVYYVSNGLITKEMISGQLQLGDATFQPRNPAEIGVAGDPDDVSGPTYKTLGGLLLPTTDDVGNLITKSIDRAGNKRGVTSNVVSSAPFDAKEDGERDDSHGETGGGNDDRNHAPVIVIVAPTPDTSSIPPTPDTSNIPPTPDTSNIPPTPDTSSIPPTPDTSSIPPTPDTGIGTSNFDQYNVVQAYFVKETGHNIAKPFWDYLNQIGPVLNSAGQQVQGRIFDPVFFVTGLPITEAWWAKVKVGGQVKDVLVQAFERRILTYTPSNSEAYQVEMGNVGQHYYKWRHTNTTPVLPPTTPLPGSPVPASPTVPAPTPTSRPVPTATRKPVPPTATPQPATRAS